jgi:hypothetical protein
MKPHPNNNDGTATMRGFENPAKYPPTAANLLGDSVATALNVCT